MTASAAVGVLLVLVGYALAVPVLSGVDLGAVDFTKALQPPSEAAWFGTDNAGRDVFAVTAAGLRVSLVVALAAAVAATVVGVIVGLAAAICGGVVDTLLMRLVDGVNVVPHLLLGIMIVTFYRGSLVAIVAAVALTHWTGVARVVRSHALALRSAGYVQAAINQGMTRRQVAAHHLLPSVAPTAGVSLALLVPHAVWHEATLSFLGLGMPPHEPSLGTLVGAAQPAVLTGAWWTLAAPALALVVATAAVTVLASVRRSAALSRGVAA